MTQEELTEAYKSLGKEGFELEITLSDNPIAVLNRISKRSKLGYKKEFTYRFKNQESMMQFIEKHYTDAVKKEESLASKKETLKQQNKAKRESVKVGDIFCYSWGYEQTNVNFYQVVAKIGSANISVIEIACESVQDCSWASDYVIPVADSFISDIEKTVRLTGNSFRRSCGRAVLTNPKDKHYRSWYA